MTHTQMWDEWYDSVGSVGKLFPNMVAKYADEEGKEVGRNEVGELWLAGPNIFKVSIPSLRVMVRCGKMSVADGGLGLLEERTSNKRLHNNRERPSFLQDRRCRLSGR